MCGFNGFIGSPPPGFKQRWEKAQSLQLHRGPDDQSEKILSLNKNKIFLGFQRLSIIDLSKSANQPMFSDNNNGIILFNGEIYNYLELKKTLKAKGVKFKTSSDTEVLLRSIDFWGPELACKKFNGMWSFAYFNLNNGKLFLSRDRFGKKPLYFFQSSEGIYFSSEAKSIMTLIGKKFSLNYQVIGEFLFQSQMNTSTNYFLNQIEQISPNSIFQFSIIDKINKEKTISYWEYPNKEQTNQSFQEKLIKIKDIFFNSVDIRLRSDVPIGLLFSGGLDSSSIAAAANQIGKGDSILFFSAVDENPIYDESPYIDLMAKHLNVDVEKINLSLNKENIFQTLENLIWINDQPLPSFSNLTHNLLINKASNKGIKVMLTGQGADELLCGYRKYAFFFLKSLIISGKLNKAARLFFNFINNKTIINQTNYPDAKRYLNFLKNSQYKKSASSNFKNYNYLDLGLNAGSTMIDRQIDDFMKFSLPQILHTEDRMSMAASSEIRAPFLDFRLVEELLPMKIDSKINTGWTKYILRKVMEPFMPAEITWRRDKQNFGNSQGELLKGNLFNKIVNDYFSKESLIFNKNIIERKKLLSLYQKYNSQKINRGSITYKEIFSSLSLEIWLRKYQEFIK